MYPDDEHLLVVGAVENPDAASFGQVAGGAPQKVVLSSASLGCLKLNTWQPCGLTPDIM